jgi:preprotein translocase subunit SecB
MQIEFSGIIIESLVITRSIDGSPDDVELKVSSGFDANQPTNFGIRFEINLIQDGWSYAVVAQSHFVANEALTEQSGEDKIIKIQAPTIAYPYVRSALSGISALSGHPVINLPVVNFLEFFEAKNEL